MLRIFKLGVTCVLLLPRLLMASPGSSDLGLFAGELGPEPPSGWTAQFHPDIAAHTQLSLVQGAEVPVLRVLSEAGYGSWAYRFEQPEQIDQISWQWQVLEKPTGADLKTKKGDDAAIKVCLFVAIDESRLGLGTRLALGAARTVSGEDLPAATLCYLWAGQPYKGQVFPNPYTDRVRNWVLRDESASDNWLQETRDVRADVIRVFGPELPRIENQPQVKLLGIAIGGDADNTKSRSNASLSTFTLR